MSPTTKQPPPIAVALLIAAAAVAVQALLVPLFAAPAAELAPRDLPVVIAGPAPAGDQLAEQLATAQPGAFEITRVDGAGEAEQAVRDRRAYAAFVLGADGPTLYTASAASPVVAQLVSRAAAESGERPMPVVDLVPASADDPRGAGFSAGFLPLTLTSMLAGIALVAVVRGWRARLAGLAAYAVLAGLGATAVLQSWLGVLGGDYLAGAAAVALFTLAAAATVAGLGAALGARGVGAGALLVFLVGNPLSAAAAAPELLPQPWGELGQWLPPGAGATLLRSVAWFDGAGAAQSLWALAGWTVLGLALVTLGRARFLPQPRQRADTCSPAA